MRCNKIYLTLASKYVTNCATLFSFANKRIRFKKKAHYLQYFARMQIILEIAVSNFRFRLPVYFRFTFNYKTFLMKLQLHKLCHVTNKKTTYYVLIKKLIMNENLIDWKKVPALHQKWMNPEPKWQLKKTPWLRLE